MFQCKAEQRVRTVQLEFVAAVRHTSRPAKVRHDHSLLTQLRPELSDNLDLWSIYF
ncbi:hypothetical protein SBA6_300057 [Candidatus Sulfopaludibacter sp. SbA6]|nr:hypothetical protein SBA6_300057 [Candidatus Sulfopaludibacter sp. SbA6]